MARTIDYRFRLGRTYRLHPFSKGDWTGTVEICRELKPADHYGNRIVLCHFRTDHGEFLGARGYVEVCYAPGGEYLKANGKHSEMLTMLGDYEVRFKTRAYAADEVEAA